MWRGTNAVEAYKETREFGPEVLAGDLVASKNNNILAIMKGRVRSANEAEKRNSVKTTDVNNS